MEKMTHEFMFTVSPSEGGMNTGGIPVNGEQEVSTQPLPLTHWLTRPVEPHQGSPNVYLNACDPGRWNQPVLPPGSGVP